MKFLGVSVVVAFVLVTVSDAAHDLLRNLVLLDILTGADNAGQHHQQHHLQNEFFHHNEMSTYHDLHAPFQSNLYMVHEAPIFQDGQLATAVYHDVRNNIHSYHSDLQRDHERDIQANTHANVLATVRAGKPIQTGDHRDFHHLGSDVLSAYEKGYQAGLQAALQEVAASVVDVGVGEVAAEGEVGILADGVVNSVEVVAGVDDDDVIPFLYEADEDDADEDAPLHDTWNIMDKPSANMVHELRG